MKICFKQVYIYWPDHDKRMTNTWLINKMLGNTLRSEPSIQTTQIAIIRVKGRVSGLDACASYYMLINIIQFQCFIKIIANVLL